MHKAAGASNLSSLLTNPCMHPEGKYTSKHPRSKPPFHPPSSALIRLLASAQIVSATSPLYLAKDGRISKPNRAASPPPQRSKPASPSASIASSTPVPSSTKRCRIVAKIGIRCTVIFECGVVKGVEDLERMHEQSCTYFIESPRQDGRSSPPRPLCPPSPCTFTRVPSQ